MKGNHPLFKQATYSLIAALALAAPGALLAEPPAAKPAVTKAAAPSPADRTAAIFEQAMRAYILEHPEVLIQSIQQFQVKQKAAKEQGARDAVVAKKEQLERDATSPVAGNRDGVTVVEFFDYRCGYCKKVRPAIAKLLESNPNVRVVYKDLPILGPDSVIAAKAALAAHKQGGYDRMHEALLATNEPITVEMAKKLAAAQGLDATRLEADMQSPEVDAAIVRNRELAESLNVQATPTFVVGNELAPGAVDLPKLEALVAQAGGAAKLQTASR
jgi:protein-disulfide isomerase